MNLGPAQRSTLINGSITLEFPPTPTAMPLSQGFQPTDAPAGGDHLDVDNVADDLKRSAGVARLFARLAGIET